MSRHVKARPAPVALLVLLVAALIGAADAGAHVRSQHLQGLSSAPADATPRIVGGNPSDIGKYPWQAKLLIETEEGSFFCGGTLIHPFIVMTAAHCLRDESGFYQPIEYIEALMGGTGLYEGETIYAADYWANNDYDPIANFPQRFLNDVGFVVLDTPSLGPRLQLAGPDERALWTPGQLAFVTGWGDTSEGGSLSPVLKEAQLPIVADETCVRPEIDTTRVDPLTMLCAGDLGGGPSICQGDSGGPLLSPIDGGGYRVVGITSWGFGCARPNKPSVFARVGADPLQAYVREMIPFIERENAIPAPYLGINVIGSGARRPGCGAAEAGVAQANAGALAAVALAKRRHVEAARTGRMAKARGKAMKATLRAKRRSQGKASRHAATRLLRARKRLAKAKRMDKGADRRLVEAIASSGQAGALLAAANTNRTTVCG